MQIIINRSKILATLACSLCIAWCSFTFGNPNPYQGVPYRILDESVWNKIVYEFQLDHKEDSPQVKAEIQKLLKDRAALYSMLKAAAPYLYYVRTQTKMRGLPGEIALIPFIESEFNPNDRSRVGATGLWQLMPKTARELGVSIKKQYDGRRNVVASTMAAIAYFRDLGKNFKGNWYLAIAAYNCGQGKVQSVERHQGTDSFWNMNLPRETQLYVPKLLALAAIIKNPEKYGVTLPKISDQPYFTTLKVKNPVSLDQVAKKSNIDIKTLKTLNPDYNHTVMPSKDGYILVVPYESADQVRTQLAAEVIT